MRTHPRPRAALFGFALSLLAVGTAHGGNLFVKLDDIKGTSVDETHKDWIEASSFQWGAGVGISSLHGQREVSVPSLSDITWTQAVDPSVPKLMGAILSGDTLARSQFDLVASAGGHGSRPPPVLSVVTEHVGLTGLSFGNDQVSASQGYGKFSMTYDPAGLGQSGTPVITTYDLGANKTTGPLTRAPVVGAGSGILAPQTGIYLRLGSGATAIAGDVTTQGYENWIQIDSAQMGVGRSYDPRTGFGSAPSISELTISQQFDATVPVVLSNLLKGHSIGQATLEYVHSGPRGPVTFMQLALNDVLFSGLSVSTGGDLPSVSESLNFTSFSQTVWQFNKDGSRGDPITVGFDAATGKVTRGSLAALSQGFGAGVYQPGVAVPIPEPQTWALTLAGLGLVLLRSRRRRPEEAM